MASLNVLPPARIGLNVKHITGLDRHQTLLLPETLEDYIAPDNPVRFLDAFVASLILPVEQCPNSRRGCGSDPTGIKRRGKPLRRKSDCALNPQTSPNVFTQPRAWLGRVVIEPSEQIR